MKALMLVVVLLVVGAGCHLGERQEERSTPPPVHASPSPLSTEEHVPYVAPSVPSTTPRVTPVVRETSRDQRSAEIERLKRRITALREAIAAAEREVAEIEARMEASPLTTRFAEARTEVDATMTTVKSHLNAIEDATRGGGR